MKDRERNAVTQNMRVEYIAREAARPNQTAIRHNNDKNVDDDNGDGNAPTEIG